MLKINRSTLYAPANSTTSLLLAEELQVINARQPDALHFLSKKDSNELFNQLVSADRMQFKFTSVVPGKSQHIQQFNISNAKALYTWLDSLKIVNSTEVFCISQFGTENDKDISISWGIVKEKCNLFFGLDYPKDNFVAFDETANWVLFYHHDDYILFATY